MYEKNTGELLEEIKHDTDMENFFRENENEFVKPLHVYLAELLKKKKLNKTQVIKNSGLNTNYVYHIFTGKKNNPSRTKILALALSMNLNFDETQYLLRYAGHGALYPRNARDAIIISAIEQKLSVDDTNALLEELGETDLLS